MTIFCSKYYDDVGSIGIFCSKYYNDIASLLVVNYLNTKNGGIYYIIAILDTINRDTCYKYSCYK